MSVLRIRRRPVPDLVESVPSRVRRVRPAGVEQSGDKTPYKAGVTSTSGATAAPGAGRHLRRSRTQPEAATTQYGRPIFLIDWKRPLSYKFAIYMVTSYQYYELSRALIPDSDYDQLCKELDAGYDDFEHQHKHLVDRGQFAAGTGYAIKYPLMVQHAAMHMLEHYAER